MNDNIDDRDTLALLDRAADTAYAVLAEALDYDQLVVDVHWSRLVLRLLVGNLRDLEAGDLADMFVAHTNEVMAALPDVPFRLMRVAEAAA